MENTTGLGLVITAKPHHYPIELSNLELLSHYETIQDYHQELSNNIIMKNYKFKPDLKLILQQPEMCPLDSFRFQIVNFLSQISHKTKVTQGIFHASCRLYDRYCSKRIVLQDQAKLVIATCLWVTAKTYGGCNHIINYVSVPTGGRFSGPNPRSRIPRLNELIHYCGGYEKYDESMFVQMERHILDTLQWDIMEPMLNDYVLNVDENCLIQYELYQSQLASCSNSASSSSSSSSTGSSSGTFAEMEEDEDLQDKIQLINVKRFLIDLSCWQLELLQYEYFEIAHGIFKLINTVLPQKPQVSAHPHTSILLTPQANEKLSNKIMNIFLDAMVNRKLPSPLIQQYSKNYKVMQFISICSAKVSATQNSNNNGNNNRCSTTTLSPISANTTIGSNNVYQSPNQTMMHSNSNIGEMGQNMHTAYATPPSSRTASTAAPSGNMIHPNKISINGSGVGGSTTSVDIMNSNISASTSATSSTGNTPYIIQGKAFLPNHPLSMASSQHHQQQPSPISPLIDGAVKNSLGNMDARNPRGKSFSNLSFTNNSSVTVNSCVSTDMTSTANSMNNNSNNNNSGVMGIGLIHHRP